MLRNVKGLGRKNSSPCLKTVIISPLSKKEIKKELSETKQIKSNDEEKLFRNLVYYEFSALLSMLNDGFKKQFEFKGCIVYAALHRNKLEEQVELFEKNAKSFKESASLNAALGNYTIHLRGKIKEGKGHDYL